MKLYYWGNREPATEQKENKIVMRSYSGNEIWQGVVGIAVIAAICIAICGMMFESGRLNRKWFGENPFQVTVIITLLILLTILIFRIIRR